MKLYLQYFVVWAALAVLTGAGGLPRLSASQFGAEVTVDMLYGDNQNPVVAASPDGREIFAAWDGLDENGNRRILLRESIDGEWLPTIRVDDEPSADNCAPSVSVDEHGNPHVAWLGRVRGKFNVFYAFRCVGRWIQYGAIAKPESLEDSCDAATIRTDETSKPWVAWQEGSGSRYAIHCGWLDPASGTFQESILSPAPRGYNLLPEIFFDPSPMVAWYSDSNAEFKISAARFVREDGKWSAAKIPDLDQMPSNRLPFLVKSASEMYAALWNDTVDGRDRAFVGFQDGATQGRGQIIDHLFGSGIYSLSGTASGNEIAAVWCSETTNDGPQVFLAHGSASPFPIEELLSNGSKSYYCRPRACALPGGAGVVWSSNAADGGDGRILYRRVQF